MCLAIPMQLIEVCADGTGTVELEGARYVVNLALVANPRVGSHVIVHAGFVIETLDEAEAQARIALFDELAQLARAAPAEAASGS